MSSPQRLFGSANQKIISKIYLIRNKSVMLDFDLAEMYDVETKHLKRQVKRNAKRFPADFMFVLTTKEYNSLRYHLGTLKRGQHSKFLPMAFTEQGVAMLSSVLNSDKSILVNIQIMRAFTRIRKMLINNKTILAKLGLLEKNLLIHGITLKKHEGEIQGIFKAIKQLLLSPANQRARVGFRRNNEREV